MSGIAILAGPAALAAAAALREGFVAALMRLHDRHGPLVAIRYPKRRRRRGQVVLVADPQVARGVLMDPAGFTDPGTYPRLGPAGCAHRRLREGIILARGEEHACQRARVLPPLAPAVVQQLQPALAAICQAEVAAWPADQATDLAPLVKRLLRRISLELLFGETELARGLDVASALEPHADLALSLGALALPFDVPGLSFHRLLAQAERAEAALIEWVSARRARPGGDDMLSALLTAGQAGGGRRLSDREAAAQLWTLYGASFHTLSAALTWLLALLAQHPDDAGRVRAAFEEPTRQPGETPQAAVDAIWEAMRLITPVPFQMRQAAAPSALPGGNFVLEPRDTVVLSALVMNRSPAVFPPDPASFRPERWSGAAAPQVSEVLAFSGGPRFCPGRAFAQMVLGEALEAVWKRWRLQLEPGRRLDYKTAITLAPRSVWVRLAPPHAAFGASPIRGRALRLAAGLQGRRTAPGLQDLGRVTTGARERRLTARPRAPS